MPKIVIQKDRCKGCLLCISFCPRGLISVDKSLNKRGVRPVKVDTKGECLGCALCALICPDCCIEVFK
ncbi:MAG: 4Fe-4S dicluster domain-containing protein [Candidatus Omnitrophica bacterium]|nr:4Fe-4S dicluster domain-containing protein [Candidatus Omnitrophota bacterium]